MKKIANIVSVFVLAFATSGIMALGPQAQSASALSGCTQYGSAKVTVTSPAGAVSSMGSMPYYQTLRSGAKGECVKSLQRMINVFCTPETDLAVDGVYGSKTYHAVKTLQYAIGWNWAYIVRVDGARIVEDGIAGKQTWAILKAFAYWGADGGTQVCNYR